MWVPISVRPYVLLRMFQQRCLPPYPMVSHSPHSPHQLRLTLSHQHLTCSFFFLLTKNVVANITAEGNALCAIGKAFNLGDTHWPLSTHCPTNAFPVASMTNSSGVPVWCTWPFLSCDARSKSVVAFDGNGNNWWMQSSTIPAAFGSLTNLQRFSLRSARLVGNIPALVFSSLNQLTFLDLFYNQLTGTIPSSINVAFVPQQGALQLDLSSNYLTGTIPSTFTKLQYMYLGSSKVQFSLTGNCFLTSPISSFRHSLYQGHCVTPHSPGLNHYIMPVIMLSCYY